MTQEVEETAGGAFCGTTRIFRIEVEVFDPTALYEAAVEHARKQALLDEDAIRKMLGGADEPDIDACIVQLFDPGVSPPGVQIEHSWCDDGLGGAS